MVFYLVCPETTMEITHEFAVMAGGLDKPGWAIVLAFNKDMANELARLYFEGSIKPGPFYCIECGKLHNGNYIQPELESDELAAMRRRLIDNELRRKFI